MLNLSGGVVTSGKEWTDDGEVHEVHSLKRRAVSATRPVPIPPQFVRMLRAHVKGFDVAPDGRLFRNQAGNYVDAAAYGITWARAREYALTRTDQTSRLAKRPYDLRHAGISFWLYSGVDPAECARRAGRTGKEGYSSGRNWELARKPGSVESGLSERRLTGENPGQAPFFVPLEEAQLLRRVRHEQVLRLL
ncbi:hypothetical protein ACWD25_51855, partial [Streptomyces sp. NPDC002920]